MRTNRRQFLQGAAAFGAASLLPMPQLAYGAWASPPNKTATGLLLPAGKRAEKVLELFLYGGLSPFESFYVVDEYGRSDDAKFPNEQFHLFANSHDRRFSDCGVNTEPLLKPFARDSNGKMVNLGPLVDPLRQRPDILARMRIMVMHHELEPHEAAIPMAMSGFRLGSTRLAGLGASIQRYFLDRDGGSRRVPYSYVLYPDGEIPTDNLRAASAIGLHTGSARPLDLRISSDGGFQEQLKRKVLGDRRGAYDDLVAYYAKEAQKRYTWEAEVVRSRGLTDHGYATGALANGDALAAILSADAMREIGGAACNRDSPAYTTAMGLELATHLLTHPESMARYAMVVDGGLETASGGGGYDVHTDHMSTTSLNLIAMLQALAAKIREPGDDDPSLLSLDDTLIVLNTEFGRTPFLQPGSGNGTNHHPYGYVTVMIGGPIGEEQAGVLGAIGPDAWGESYVTPVESRAAVLAGMGIWPFAQESYAIGDIRDLSKELDGLAWLNEIVLGRRA